ncbi:M20/M25/M40 family metallo-hydrolase [Sinorhizobium medicae]|nr:M20/M25/M40 family metallo-hydrolase [Sinorhizobium medicae]MDX0916773.1 M20/M25/M40 family metallo-hydrolase [Sinorhizobium medicae]MDX0958830.1 M20/M25/M40 family metallo-hydrolase [Sinorhizobium medicae]
MRSSVKDVQASALSGRIDDAIDRLAPGAEQLLEQLVGINSINPGFPGIDRESVIGGETACTRLIGAYLSKLDFELNDVAADPQRINLAAVLKGTGGGRSLLFNGHVDTVAPFKPEAWTSGDPWKPVRRGEELFGLGSTDMKGGLAAACLAIAALKEAGVRLKGDLQVHAVVGEETMDHENGTTAVIKAGFRSDAAIVAEPSSQPEPLTIAPVSAGNFNLEISVKGHGTHAGNRGAAIRAGGEGPSAGVNAVEKLIKVVQALQDLEQEWGITKRHPAFPPGLFSLVPGVFHGDVGVPSVGYMADHAYVGYLVWYAPQEDPEAVKAEIERHVHHAAQLDPWLRENPPTFSWRSHWPVADVSTEHPLVDVLVRSRSAVLGPPPAGRPATASFNAVSDASFLQAQGIPAIVLGPGNIRYAHAVDERLNMREWRECARIYARAIAEWCGTAD